MLIAQYNAHEELIIYKVVSDPLSQYCATLHNAQYILFTKILITDF